MKLKWRRTDVYVASLRRIYVTNVMCLLGVTKTGVKKLSEMKSTVFSKVYFSQNLDSCCCGIVVYVYGKHLRSCRVLLVS